MTRKSGATQRRERIFIVGVLFVIVIAIVFVVVVVIDDDDDDDVVMVDSRFGSRFCVVFVRAALTLDVYVRL